jgi:hypothetical protein
MAMPKNRTIPAGPVIRLQSLAAVDPDTTLPSPLFSRYGIGEAATSASAGAKRARAGKTGLSFATQAAVSLG